MYSKEPTTKHSLLKMQWVPRLVISGWRRLAIYNLQVPKSLAISLICDTDYQVLPDARYGVHCSTRYQCRPPDDEPKDLLVPRQAGCGAAGAQKKNLSSLEYQCVIYNRQYKYTTYYIR